MDLAGDDGEYMPIRFPYFDNNVIDPEFDINDAKNKIKMLSDYINMEEHDGVSFVKLNLEEPLWLYHAVEEKEPKKDN